MFLGGNCIYMQMYYVFIIRKLGIPFVKGGKQQQMHPMI